MTPEAASRLKAALSLGLHLRRGRSAFPNALDAGSSIVTASLHGDGYPVHNSTLVSWGSGDSAVTPDLSQASGDRPVVSMEPAFVGVKGPTRNLQIEGFGPTVLGSGRWALALQCAPQTRGRSVDSTILESVSPTTGHRFWFGVVGATQNLYAAYYDDEDNVLSEYDFAVAPWGSLKIASVVAGPTSEDGGIRTSFALRPEDPDLAQLMALPGMAVQVVGWAAAAGTEILVEVVREARDSLLPGDLFFSSNTVSLTAPSAPELSAGVWLVHHGRYQGFIDNDTAKVTSGIDVTSRMALPLLLELTGSGGVRLTIRDRVIEGTFSNPAIPGSLDGTGAVASLGSASGSAVASLPNQVVRLGWSTSDLTDAQRASWKIDHGIYFNKRRSGGPDTFWAFATEHPDIPLYLAYKCEYLWMPVDAADGSRPELLGYPDPADFWSDLDAHPGTGHNPIWMPSGPFASFWLGDPTGETEKTYNIHLLVVAPEQRHSDLAIIAREPILYGKVGTAVSTPATAAAGWTVIDATDSTLTATHLNGGSSRIVRLADGDYGVLSGSSYSYSLEFVGAGASGYQRIIVVGTGTGANLDRRIGVDDNNNFDLRILRFNLDDTAETTGPSSALIAAEGVSLGLKTGLKFWGINQGSGARRPNNYLFGTTAEGPWFNATRCAFKLNAGYGQLSENIGPAWFAGWHSDVADWDAAGAGFRHPLRIQRNAHVGVSGFIDAGTDTDSVGVAFRACTTPAYMTDVWTPALVSLNYAGNFGNVAPRQQMFERVVAGALRETVVSDSATRRCVASAEGLTSWESTDTEESRELFTDVVAYGSRSYDDTHEFEGFRAAPLSGPLLNYVSTLLDFGPPVAPAIADAYRDSGTGHVVLIAAGPPRGGGYYVQMAWERRPVGSDTWMALAGHGQPIAVDLDPPAGACDYRVKVTDVNSSMAAGTVAYSDPVRVDGIASVDDLMPALLDLDPASLVGGAAEFGGPSSLSVASDAGLQLGAGVAAWGSAWVRLTGKAATGRVVGKYEVKREWLVHYHQPTDRFRLITASDGESGTVVTTPADALGAPKLNTWYFLLWWYDPVAGNQYLRVNALTADSSARSTGIYSYPAPFAVGGTSDGLESLDGRVAIPMYGKPAGAIADVIGDIHDTLYASGAGATYADLTPTQVSDWGLVTAPDLAGTTWQDQHGAYDLAAFGPVGSARGPVEAAFPAGGLVRTWTDAVRLAAPTQATAANRPAYTASGLDFDGTNDSLAVAAGNPLEDETAATVLVGATLDGYGGSGSTAIKCVGASGSWSVGLTSGGVVSATYDPDSGASATATGSGAVGTGALAWFGLRLNGDGTLTAWRHSSGSIVHGAAVTPGAGRSIAGATLTIGDGTLDGRIARVVAVGRALTDAEIAAAVAGGG